MIYLYQIVFHQTLLHFFFSLIPKSDCVFLDLSINTFILLFNFYEFVQIKEGLETLKSVWYSEVIGKYIWLIVRER
jgi:hypothetical protein